LNVRRPIEVEVEVEVGVEGNLGPEGNLGTVHITVVMAPIAHAPVADVPIAHKNQSLVKKHSQVFSKRFPVTDGQTDRRTP
jgi:hypothetical protein